MTKRGRVLRDTASGPGLLMIEGQQYRFSLAGVWKSELPPKPGMVVDVEFDARDNVQGITVVPDSQLVREQKQQAQAAMAPARQKSQNPATSLLSIGGQSLIAAGLLAVAWFFLTAVSIQVPFPGKQEFTFWQLLGFLNGGNVPELLDGRNSPSAGGYGFVVIVALAGPFLHYFWKDKRARLGGLLPLLFMVIAGIAIRLSIQRDEAIRAVSLGLGTYLSILASLYFAVISGRGFLTAKTREGHRLESTRQKAA